MEQHLVAVRGIYTPKEMNTKIVAQEDPVAVVRNGYMGFLSCVTSYIRL